MTVARLAPGQHLSVGNIKPCGARPHQIAQARSLGPGQLDLLLARPAHGAPPVAGISMPLHQGFYTLFLGRYTSTI
jgi:hypothetical protein